MELDGRPNDVTVRAYELGADAYARTTPANMPGSIVGLIDAFLALLGPEPRVLEIGSGTGRDADLLERRGASVMRTDAATSFVRRLRDPGHQAGVVNVLTDDLGGPYDGVFANAVLPHLRREDLPGVLVRLHDAVRTEGALAFTLKAGGGDAWSQEKLGFPRYYAYWTVDELREVVGASPWQLVEAVEVVGATTNWVLALCRRA